MTTQDTTPRTETARDLRYRLVFLAIVFGALSIYSLVVTP